MTLPTNSGEPVRIWLYANTEPMLKISDAGFQQNVLSL